MIDKGVRIPAGIEIGVDLELDRKRGFTISNNGVVTVAKTEDLSSLEPNSSVLAPIRTDSGSNQIIAPKGLSATPPNSYAMVREMDRMQRDTIE